MNDSVAVRICRRVGLVTFHRMGWWLVMSCDTGNPSLILISWCPPTARASTADRSRHLTGKIAIVVVVNQLAQRLHTQPFIGRAKRPEWWPRQNVCKKKESTEKTMSLSISCGQRDNPSVPHLSWYRSNSTMWRYTWPWQTDLKLSATPLHMTILL